MRRYLLVKVCSEKPVAFTGDQLMDAIMVAVRKFFGEFGANQIDPRMIRFDSSKAEAIIACRKDQEGELQAAVALITEICGSSIAALTLKVSGTIKSLST